ncbi:MAG: DMT family transporter [Pseudomonadota bacterium]
MSDRWALPALLVITGTLNGLLAPFAKVAVEAGVPLTAFLFWPALGAGLLLTVLATLRGTPPKLTLRYCRYGLITGGISFAFPNFVVAWVVPYLGSGLTSLMFVLSPPITYALAVGIRLDSIRLIRVLGILLGGVGALMILLPRSGLPSVDQFNWMLIAFLIPASVALGNIYRTVDWPPGAQILPLAAVMMWGAAIWLGAGMIAADHFYWPFGLTHAGDWAVLAQIAATTLAYIAFFELQRRGGPVYLSQIGYLITLTGMVAGIAFLGERMTWWIWAALPVMFAGLAMVNAQQSSRK